VDKAEVLARVGEEHAQLLRKPGWVHRRVESLNFPLPDDLVVRRHLSIDFSIPEEAKPIANSSGERGEESIYYLPLSVLRKWPPVLNLDLRNAADIPIPLLTRSQNAVIDGAVLTELACRSLDIASADLDEHLQGQLKRIAEEQEAIAQAILRHQLLRELPRAPETAFENQREALRRDPDFLDVAGAMTSNTILWLRVRGCPGQRHIIKFAYDSLPVDLRIGLWKEASYGWAPFNVKFAVPHFGDAGSYHLDITAPAPLEIVDADLFIKPRVLTAGGGTTEAEIEPLRLAGGGRPAATGDSEEEEIPAAPETAASHQGRHAHFYVAGQRARRVGEARISVMAERGGFIRGAFLAAAMISALLLAFSFNLDAVVRNRATALAMLLIVPSLLAYLVVRPREHLLAAQLVRGLRNCLLVIGALPLIASVFLILVGKEPTGVFTVAFRSVAVVSVVLTVEVMLQAVLPMTDSRRMPLTAGRRQDLSSSSPDYGALSVRVEQAASAEAGPQREATLRQLQRDLDNATLRPDELADLSDRLSFYAGGESTLQDQAGSAPA
jgi:hypothetical protein